MGGDLRAMSRDVRGRPRGPASVPEHFWSTPFALSLLSASLLHMRRAFLSTPIALSLLSASLLHMPRAFLSTPIARSLLSASLLHSLAKAIFEHPYRTFCLSNGGDLSAMSRDGRGVI